MVEAWDEAFREDAASEGPPFSMPSLTVVRRQEPVLGTPQPSGITTAANPYGNAIKNVFEFHPAEQTDDEKEALAIARMEVMQHLHTIKLSEANTSALAENTGDDLDNAVYPENGDDEAEPGNDMEFLSELADDLEIDDDGEAAQVASPTSAYQQTLEYNNVDSSLRR